MSASWEIRQGDCIELMAAMPEASVDAVVTDPPYGLSFMGAAWDTFSPATMKRRVGRRTGAVPPSDSRDGRAKGRATSAFANSAGEAGAYDFSIRSNRGFQAWCERWAQEALRVLRPGGHAVIFGGTRTFHRLTCGIEDAGFEIRDCLTWLYGSGFPKSLNLDGDWQGWGTALKPGWEPIVLARAPLEGTVRGNVLARGTGALHIDACRLTVGDAEYARNCSGDRGHAGTRPMEGRGSTDLRPGGGAASLVGRWPANTVLSHTEDCVLVGERQVRTGTAGGDRGFQAGAYVGGEHPQSGLEPMTYADENGMETVEAWECAEGCPVAMLDEQSGEPARGVDRGGASRFFYCAKASRGERNAGLDGFEQRMPHDNAGHVHADGRAWDVPGSHSTARANHHPTVKPIELMRWLVRLVTPPAGLVLDPFCGSGTTGCAAVREGFRFVGLEREAEYVSIARARIGWWAEHPEGLPLEAAIAADRQRAAARAAGQSSLFDEGA